MPGRAPPVGRARPPDRSRQGRARARPLHRQRDPGDPARRARGARRRDGRQRAGARLRERSTPRSTASANVETRPGSFFEPVDGEQFDLVVANPPYVVSPESAYLFRDGGMRGDAVSEHVVRATPAALAPGAFASRPDRVGARSRRSGRAPAELAGGLGLRRVPAPHVDGRPDRDRDGVESRSRSTSPTPTPRRSTAGSRTTASSGSSSSATPASCCASAPTAATAGWRRMQLPQRRASPGGAARAEALRDSRPAVRARLRRRAPRPAAARRRRRRRHAGHALRRRPLARGEPDAPARERAALLRGARPDRRRDWSASSTARGRWRDALASVVDDAGREEGASLARRMLEVGFLELDD